MPRSELRAELTGLLRLLPVRDDDAAERPGQDRRRAGGLPPVVVPELAGRACRRARERRRRRARRARRRPPAIRATPSGRGSSSPATCSRPADARVRRRDDRRLRRAPRRPPVRRRRGDRRGSGPARRSAGRRRRSAEGLRHRGEHPAQLRDAASGGLPQGDAGDGARGAFRAPGRHLRRRPRRPPGARVRGARHRRGDRPFDRADEPPAHADRHGHHRRGRLGRRARDRGRRRRHRPRERGLLGHLARGLRLDPVADAPTRHRPPPWR